MTKDELYFAGAGYHHIEQTPGSIVFHVNTEPIVMFHPDGRITLGEHAKPDEAAREMLRILAEVFPEQVKTWARTAVEPEKQP